MKTADEPVANSVKISKTGRMKFISILVLLIWLPLLAFAHASDQAFVVMLPTGAYTIAGGLTVGVTIALVALISPEKMMGLGTGHIISWPRLREMRNFTSILTTLGLFYLFYEGLTGSRDPLANLLPLGFWVGFWIGFVFLQGVFGNLWHWVNPWSGIYAVVRKWMAPKWRMPAKSGYLLGVVLLMCFAYFLMVDPAPADPARLAWIGLFYWAMILIGMMAFGPAWQRRVDLFGLFLGHFASLSPMKLTATGLRIGWPGWQIAARRPRVLSWAIVPLIMLATGSFDGVNETFWWFGKIGVNPLMYPGRSAVILPTVIGLVVAVICLLAVFALALHLGRKLASDRASFATSLTLFAPTVLPIAFGYHIAHYLPGFLVDVQYVALTITQRLGGEPFYVTTSFFFDPPIVRIIWLTQASMVVLGHMISIIIAHIVALRHFGTPRRAFLSQIPLGAFMVAYTFFGLWLLASPRGG